jgi:hypothetical protein
MFYFVALIAGSGQAPGVSGLNQFTTSLATTNGDFTALTLSGALISPRRSSRSLEAGNLPLCVLTGFRRVFRKSSVLEEFVHTN